MNDEKLDQLIQLQIRTTETLILQNKGLEKLVIILMDLVDVLKFNGK